MSGRWRAVVTSGLLLLPGTTLAHSPIEGLNNFYNGFLHPIFVPAHLLLLISAGLLVGQLGVRENRAALLAFVIAALAGLIVAWLEPGIGSETFILAAAAAIGLVVAASPRIGLLPGVVIAAVAGFALGADSPQESLAGRDKLIAFFGTGVAIYVLFLYPMAMADYCRKRTWQKVAVRVAGSWVAASALLVLALAFATAR